MPLYGNSYYVERNENNPTDMKNRLNFMKQYIYEWPHNSCLSSKHTSSQFRFVRDMKQYIHIQFSNSSKLFSLCFHSVGAVIISELNTEM